jgi:hypothetical protein
VAWLEQRGERFRIAFRFRGEKYRVNPKTTDRKEAEGCLAQGNCMRLPTISCCPFVCGLA